MNSLARETTWDPALQKLNFFPIVEYEQLRGGALASLGATDLSDDVDLGLPDLAGLRSELRVSFELPEAGPVRLGVKIATGGPVADAASVIFVDFVPNANASDTWEVWAGFDVPNGGKLGSLTLKASDETLDLALWTDANTIEAF